MMFRRILQAVCIFAMIVLFFSLACSKIQPEEIDGIWVGVYCDNSVEKETFAPCLELEADGTGSFSYCAASSHWPFGTWVVENGQMILTEDMLYADETDYRRYVFDVVDGTLVFRQDLSWQLPDFGEMEYQARDGSVFVYSEKLTEMRK